MRELVKEFADRYKLSDSPMDYEEVLNVLVRKGRVVMGRSASDYWNAGFLNFLKCKGIDGGVNVREYHLNAGLQDAVVFQDFLKAKYTKLKQAREDIDFELQEIHEIINHE